jgi:hypothetical protein
VSTTAREHRVTGLLASVDEDAALLDVPPRTVRRFLVLPWVAAALLAATALHRPLFRFLMREDSILEWAQVLLMAAAMVVAVRVALEVYREGNRLAALLWVAFAAGCFIIAGEEIAWGQRLLHLDTPVALDRVNHQGEITAHNIRGVQDTINLIFIGAGLYGTAAAAFFRLRPDRRPSEQVQLLTPPLFLGSLFLIVVGYKSARFLFFHEARYLVVKYGEFVELCLGVAFFAFAWYTLRRLRDPARHLPPGVTVPD